MSSSNKTPDAERFGGPGSSQQNRKDPEKGEPEKPSPHEGGAGPRAKVSGGGGEADVHHERNTHGKSGRD